jgi:hypothetical protein
MVSNNYLSMLPYEISKLDKLRYLDISRNDFRTFPSVLFEMPSLSYLNMSRNKIRKFPKSIGNLMALKVLNVSKNRLTELPAYIADMTNLKELIIDDNPLAYPSKSVLRKSKSMSEEDWLVRLKDWLRYDEVRNRGGLEESPTNRGEREGSYGEESTSYGGSSLIALEALESRHSLEDLRKTHSKRKEKLTRQYELELKLLKEKHEKDLKREYERHQSTRKRSGPQLVDLGASDFLPANTSNNAINRESMISQVSNISAVTSSSFSDHGISMLEKLCDSYFRDATGVQHVTQEDEELYSRTMFIGCARSITWSSMKILNLLGTIMTLFPPVDRTERCLPVYEEAITGLIDLISSLKDMDLESSSVDLVSNLSLDRKASMRRLIKRGKEQLQSTIQQLREVLLIVHSFIKDNGQYVDIRIIRGMLAEWYAIVSELKHAQDYAQKWTLSRPSHLPRPRGDESPQNMSTEVKGSPIFEGTYDDINQEHGESEMAEPDLEDHPAQEETGNRSTDDLAIVSAGERACVSTTLFLKMLKEMIGQPDESDQDTHSFDKELWDLIARTEKALVQFNGSRNLLAKHPQDVALRRQVYEDADVFSKMMLRLNVLARTMFLENVDQYKLIRPHWQEVSESIKELVLKTVNDFPGFLDSTEVDPDDTNSPQHEIPTIS